MGTTPPSRLAAPANRTKRNLLVPVSRVVLGEGEDVWWAQMARRWSEQSERVYDSVDLKCLLLLFSFNGYIVHL